MSTPTRRRTTSLWVTLLVAAPLLAGCGSGEPEPLEAMQPEVPADLCATVPAEVRKGLDTSSSSDPSGNPTAACSLRSPVGADREVRAVVTWMKTNDEISADEVLDSQCQSLDRQSMREQRGFQVEGAESACAASGKVDGADSATMAAVTDLEVVTVRVSSLPPGKDPSLSRARQIAEGVLSSSTGGS